MKKLTLLALCCLLLAVGCQNQSPSNENTSDQSSSSVTTETTQTSVTPTIPASEAEQKAAETSPPAAGEGDSAYAAGSLQAKLAHHNFVIKTVDGEEFVIKLPPNETSSPWAKPNLSFGEWPFASGKICNSYRGDVEIQGQKLFMKNAASTMMLCADTGLSEFESLFYKIMGDGVEVSFGEDNSLILKGGDHVLVFELADYVN